MKKIIDGKRYDTSTADLVAVGGNDLPCSDFRECTERLYRTKRGAWFIHGSGGPMSRWAVSLGNNSWGGGSSIIVLSDREAQEWLEQNCETEALEQYFTVVDA